MLEIPREAERPKFLLSERSEFKNFSEASGGISPIYFSALSRLRFSKFSETEHKKILNGMVLLYQDKRTNIINLLEPAYEN